MTTTSATIDVYCASCGEDGQADATTGKCVRCGRHPIAVPATQDTLAREKFGGGGSVNGFAASTNGTHTITPAAAPAAAPAQSTVKLPNTPQMRRWLDATTALHADLVSSAQEASKRAKAIQAESDMAQKTAGVFSQLLRQLELASPASTTIGPLRNITRAGEKRWSRGSAVQVDACIDCDRDSIKHVANGRCAKCDRVWRNAQKKG